MANFDITFSDEYASFIMPTADELKKERRVEEYAKANNITFAEAERELYPDGIY